MALEYLQPLLAEMLYADHAVGGGEPPFAEF